MRDHRVWEDLGSEAATANFRLSKGLSASPFHFCYAEITSSRSSPVPWLVCLVFTPIQTASTARTWNTSDLLTSNLGWVQEGLCFFCFDLTITDFSLSSHKRLRLPSMRSRCSTEVLIVIWMVGIAFRSQQSWAASWRPKFWRWRNVEMYFNVTCFIPTDTSSTAQGGGGSFKKTKTIGEIDCCESWMSEQKHWPTD